MAVRRLAQLALRRDAHRLARAAAKPHPVPAKPRPPPVVLAHPELDRVAGVLSGFLPAIPVRSDYVEILREPKDFLSCLQAGIERARRRIVLATLYLGNGELERDLVRRLTEACNRNPALRVTILMDCLRATRTSSRDAHDSSVHVLSPLIDAHPSRVHVALFHTPQLRGLLKRVLPQRLNETVGVQHIKAYAFDDDIVLSGANLSGQYFTQRQDRNVLLREAPALADFYHELVDTVAGLSFAATPAAAAAAAPLRMADAAAPDPSDAAQRALQGPPPPPPLRPLQPRATPTPHPPPRHLVFPTVQLGPCDLRLDQRATCELLLRAASLGGSEALLSSGYFNFTREPPAGRGRPPGTASLRIVTASPRANGFYGARGMSGLIPPAYTYLERQFYERIKAMGLRERVSILEYSRAGWTYHAKGLWWSPAAPGGRPGPCGATMVGSPNFGSRSVERDLESQVVLLTRGEALQEALAQEREGLLEHCEAVTGETFRRPERRLSLVNRVATRVARGFL
eukprot:tig00000851_g4885.t1